MLIPPTISWPHTTKMPRIDVVFEETEQQPPELLGRVLNGDWCPTAGLALCHLSIFVSLCH